jgi:HipA-like protein
MPFSMDLGPIQNSPIIAPSQRKSTQPLIKRATSTLSLSFKDALGSLITDVRPTQTRLPVFFANLLPEGTMRDYLAARASVKPEREFFLLAALGRDLPGALEIQPADAGMRLRRPVHE